MRHITKRDGAPERTGALVALVIAGCMISAGRVGAAAETSPTATLAAPVALAELRAAPGGWIAADRFIDSFHAMVREAEAQADPARRQEDYALLADGARRLARNRIWEMVCLRRAVEAGVSPEIEKNALLRMADIYHSGHLGHDVIGNPKDVDVPEGLKIVEGMLQSDRYDPWRAEALVAKGQLLHRAGRLDEAGQAWEQARAEASDPVTRARATAHVAHDLARQGRADDAVALLNDAAAEAGQADDPAAVLEMAPMRLGTLQGAQRDAERDEAIAGLRARFEGRDLPYDLEMRYLRALLPTPHRAGALERMEALILGSPEAESRWEDLQQLGRQILTDGGVDRLTALWQACTAEADPAAIPVDMRSGLIQSYRQAGREAEAQALIQELLDTANRSDDYGRLIGTAYVLWRQGREDLGRALFLKGFDLVLDRYDEVEWIEEKADILLKIAIYGFWFDIVKAVDYAAQEIARLPAIPDLDRFAIDIRYFHAMTFLTKGQPLEGIAELDAILAAYPPSPRLAKVEGQRAQSLADWDRAQLGLTSAPAK